MPLFGIESVCELRTVVPILALTLTDGLHTGWSSPATKKMDDGDTPFPVTKDQLSWAVPCYDLGLFIGCVSGAIAFSHFGRRVTLSLAPLIYSLSVLLLALAPAADYMLVARFLAGVGSSVSLSFNSIYVAEVSTRTARGTISLLCTALSASGTVFQYTIAPYITFKQQALMPVPSLLLCAAGIVLWMEESPFYLAATEREDAVVDVLARLRVTATPYEVRREASHIMASVRQQKSESTSWRQALAVPGVKKAAIIVVAFCGANGLWGYTSLLGYTALIFKEAGSPIPVDIAAMVMMIIKTSAIVLAVTVVGRSARRPFLIGSLCGNFLCLLGMSAFFLVKDSYVLPEWTSWLPIAILYSFVVSHGLGGIPVPHIIMGELLPMHLKAFVAPLSVCVVSATSFVLTKSFLLVGESVGFWLPFGFFALTNLFGAVFGLIMLPETKGKTLMEVQDMLRDGPIEKKERI